MAARSSKSPIKKSKQKVKSSPGAKRQGKGSTRPARGIAARKTGPAGGERRNPAPTKVIRSKSAPLTGPATRGTAAFDDDDVLMARGGGGGGFGRCGGRQLSSRLEQQLCHSLGIAGVVHSHSPRHYEIRLPDGKVAAYAPMIVLRGRGREGKGVVIEAVEDPASPILRKIVAFRSQYGQEFYIMLIAADDVLEEIELAAYDESCSATNINTLTARLAE